MVFETPKQPPEVHVVPINTTYTCPHTHHAHDGGGGDWSPKEPLSATSPRSERSPFSSTPPITPLTPFPFSPTTPATPTAFSRIRLGEEEPAIPLSKPRRWMVLFTICWMLVPMTFSSASILATVPEVAADLSVSPKAISFANAGVLVAMAVSPLVWIPVSKVIGRRMAYIVAATLLGVCSLNAALAPNMPVFALIWVIGGVSGVVFLVFGQTIISDTFEPTERGAAVGIFLGTCVTATAVAPMTGGIMASYTNWRAIYGLQAGMTLLGLTLACFFLPADLKKVTPMINGREPPPRRKREIFSPLPVFRVLKNGDVLCANIVCGLLAFNQYGLLSSIRYSITDRFHSESQSPLTSGLFYLAPAAGFLLGSTLGGRLSDYTVKKYIRKRNGHRLPRDRLRSSGLAAMFAVSPLGSLLLGWSLEMHVGGLALPAAGAFLAGLGLMASFSSLNTFTAEITPEKKTEAISSKYMIQFLFASVVVASRVHMMELTGVGWAFTISATINVLAGTIVLLITGISAAEETERDAGGKGIAL